jgi:hypothetical protein
MDRVKKPLQLALSAACLVLLASCSEPAQKTEQKLVEPAKPPEPVKGLSALYQMYRGARGTVGADIEPVRCNSIHLAEVKAEPGKAAAWQCTFVSASAGKSKTYTYSVIESSGNLHKGVFAGLDESYTRGRGPKPFPMAAVKVDSDAAYQAALTKAASYEKKNPGKTISFLLEKNDKFPDVNATWRVIWGESVGTSNFSVIVDATTGAYLQTLH